MLRVCAWRVQGSSEEEELEDMFELEGDGMRLYQEIMEFRLSYRRSASTPTHQRFG